MEMLRILAVSTYVLTCLLQTPTVNAGETVLSTVLTPTEDTKDKSLNRQGRSYYYDQIYGANRPLYDRLQYDRPTRCGRCDERDDYDRPSRDRYDDDRRVNHRPTYGSRYDRNKNYDDEDDDDKRYNSDRRMNNDRKNGTEDQNDTDKRRPNDDKDNKSSGNRKGSNRDRNRDDDRDRYRPDYYDRFLRDPYRDRYDRNRYYDDLYSRERRPLFDRYPYGDEGYGGRYDGYGYPGYRKPTYDDRYDRGYYDDGYGGYGPGVGRGQHDSFRPWDETYRGQAGWDAGGRGYYFASGRPDSAPASAWSRPEYSRPDTTSSSWQSVGYRDPLEYRGSFGYGENGYRQDVSTGYARPNNWYNVGERRPYRDQSGVNKLDNKGLYNQPSRNNQNNNYGQPNNLQPTYGQPTYGQTNNIGTNGYGQTSSTTPGTSYLYQREDEKVPVTAKSTDETTKSPS